MNPRPMALLHGSTLHAANRTDLVRTVLGMVARAERGIQATRTVYAESGGFGTVDTCVSHTYRGPRGGAALVVRLIGTDTDADGALALARTCLEALESPSWSRDEKVHANQVARAIALLARDARPDDRMWAGFLSGPTGAARCEVLPAGGGRWETASPPSSFATIQHLPAVRVRIDKPSRRGAMPHAVTLDQMHAHLDRAAVDRIDAMERLRLMALIHHI